jgi:hypothetical protein
MEKGRERIIIEYWWDVPQFKTEYVRLVEGLVFNKKKFEIEIDKLKKSILKIFSNNGPNLNCPNLA